MRDLNAIGIDQVGGSGVAYAIGYWIGRALEFTVDAFQCPSPAGAAGIPVMMEPIEGCPKR